MGKEAFFVLVFFGQCFSHLVVLCCELPGGITLQVRDLCVKNIATLSVDVTLGWTL